MKGNLISDIGYDALFEQIVYEESHILKLSKLLCIFKIGWN